MKKTKLLLPILGIAGLAATVPTIVGCSCAGTKAPAWLKYFDDPGEKVRHQKASGVGTTVEYEFNLKETVPTGEKVYGDVEVVKYSHNGVEADVTDFELNEGQRKATFTAKITKVPTTIANGTTTYWADIKAEVKCKKTTGDEVVWETTIEDMRVEVEVGDAPEPAYDEVINLSYVGEGEGRLESEQMDLVSGTKYKIAADFTSWTSKTVERAYALEFEDDSGHEKNVDFTANGVIQGSIVYEGTEDEDYFWETPNCYFHHPYQHRLFMNVESFGTEIINIYITVNNDYDDITLWVYQPK